MTGVFNFASSAAFAVMVLFAVGPASAMKLSEVGFRLLLTTSALGAFVGSFISEWAEAKLGRSKSLALTILGSALLVGAPAVTDNPYILGALLFVGGLLAQWLGLQAMFGIMGVLTLELLGMMPILTNKAIIAADVEP